MAGSALATCVSGRDAYLIAVRHRDGVAVPLPFLGVSSLNFGPLATAALFHAAGARFLRLLAERISCVLCNAM
jgi:hypothetical protein